MKFSHQLQFNAVPDWADYYVPYSNLKKLVYSIERDRILAGSTMEDIPNEQTALLDNQHHHNDNTTSHNDRFIAALDRALDRIVNFYSKKETELYDAVDTLLIDLEAQATAVASSTTTTTTTPVAAAHSDHPPQAHQNRQQQHKRTHSTSSLLATQNLADHDPEATRIDMGAMDDEREQLRRHAVDLFVQLSELKSFVSLNATAFAKILKKYDKITGSELKRYYTSNYVTKAYPFRTATKQKLNATIQRIEHGYAALTHQDDTVEDAVRELKAHLRDRIVWERNTIWRDMIGQERKVQNMGNVAERKLVHTPFGDLDRSTLSQLAWLVACLVVFFILLKTELFADIEQNRCFAILIFASMLWATEVMPLFATAMIIPLLVVVLGVMRSADDGHERLSAPEAAKVVFSGMFSSVIMLLLGGFAIAGSLSKFGIAKSMATFVLSRAGTRPSRVLLVNMFVATVTSMWISNVAAPVLCFSLIQPILRTLPVDSSFGSCLIIGIALASNLGGLASPISSPQNIIAIQNMDPAPSWGQWFLISIPVSIIGNMIIWLWLLFSYRPEKNTSQIHTIRASQDPITGTQIFVMLVTVVTIALWCVAHSLEGMLGDMGIIAIIPLVAFFGTGLLTKDDFNHFLWTVIMLAMGGTVLGKAVESSGLLRTIATSIQHMVTGFSTFEVLIVFSLLVVVIATFISHTVAALIILPIVAEVGAEMTDPHPRLLVMGTVFICSIAMGLPVSGFPNMNAVSQENELGKPYLSTKDFLRNGVPCSLLCLLCVTSIGYGLMNLAGF